MPGIVGPKNVSIKVCEAVIVPCNLQSAVIHTDSLNSYMQGINYYIPFTGVNTMI